MLTGCLQNDPLTKDWIDLLVPKLSYLVQHRISVAISCFRVSAHAPAATAPLPCAQHRRPYLYMSSASTSAPIFECSRTTVLCLSLTNLCTRRSEEHTSELQSRDNLVCRL